MKNRALIIGLLAGIAGIALSAVYTKRVEREVSGGTKVQIVVAVDTITRGKVITSNMLGTRDVPASYVDDRTIRAADIDKVLNLKATSTIPVQQSLAWTDLIAAKDDQRALSDLVQPGNRAMPIRVQINDVLTLIHPGDFVDILCVSNDTKEASVLLQRVLILATGLETSKEADKKDSGRPTVLTVSVSLPESQLLAVGMEKGKLSVVVRSPGDPRIAEAPADVGPQALNDAARRQAVQSPRRRAPSGPVQLKEVPH